MNTDNKSDVVVIGGGLVGLASAYAIAVKRPDQRVAVLEAEDGVALHQSGRNSGVLHSGIYYQPGSLKAQLCREGAQRMVEFCDTYAIALEHSGKVIVATDDSQIPALEEIERRGHANGLHGLRTLSSGELAEMEPYVTARASLSVPEAGVVDFDGVAQRLSTLISAGENTVRTGFRVSAINRTGSGYRITAESGAQWEAQYLVNCARLQSDRVAKMAGEEPPVNIIPFRGEYYVMPKNRDYLVGHLVYPVPDPQFPFLGIHFTRRIDGSVEVGPNAVLALGRHHYRGEAKPNWKDVREMMGSAGLWRLGEKDLGVGGS